MSMLESVPSNRDEGQRRRSRKQEAVPESNGSRTGEGWMDGIERFFSLLPPDLVPAVKEIRVVRDASRLSPDCAMLVLATPSRDAVDRLTAAARVAFPGWVVQVSIPIEGSPIPRGRSDPG